jgi:protein kinase C substrate 80K-H
LYLFTNFSPIRFLLLDTSHATQALNDAEQTLATSTRAKTQLEEDLSKLFNTEWFGREGEFKKLDGTCLEKNTGE